jgi:hypothetical protein
MSYILHSPCVRVSVCVCACIHIVVYVGQNTLLRRAAGLYRLWSIIIRTGILNWLRFTYDLTIYIRFDDLLRF